MVAVEDDALHGTGWAERFADDAIEISLVQAAAKIVTEGAQPAEHVFPRKQDGDGHTFVCWIFRVPAIDRYRVTRLFIIVRKDGRELLKHHMRGKFIVTIVEPGFGIERGVVAGAHGIVPLPGAEGVAGGTRSGEHLGETRGIPFGFLKHRELIGPHGLIFMNTGLQVPPSKIPAIGARESSGAETANGRALPVAVINVVGGQRDLFGARARKWFSDGALPSSARNAVILSLLGLRERRDTRKEQQNAAAEKLMHE